MEIKFIGTGAGRTSLKRYHSSFIINAEGYNLLVDAGDGVSRAILQQKILFNIIDGILISHLHPDHYSGLPSLIVQMKMKERVNPLYIFCDKNNSDFIQDFIYQSYLFEERLGFKINVMSFQQDRKLVVYEGLNFTARLNTHLEKKNADKNKRLSFSSSSFLFEVKGKNIFFTGDIAGQKDLFLFSEKKIDLMISEITHVKVAELVDAFRRLNPDKMYITHLSEEDEKKVSELSYQLPVRERKKVVAASDGLNVKI